MRWQNLSSQFADSPELRWIDFVDLLILSFQREKIGKRSGKSSTPPNSDLQGAASKTDRFGAGPRSRQLDIGMS